MKIFIWQGVSGITDSYHDGGGVAVIAEDLEAARAHLGRSSAMKEAPDFVFELKRGTKGPQTIVFPDSGCC
jgi:hypothetical protein